MNRLNAHRLQLCNVVFFVYLLERRIAGALQRFLATVADFLKFEHKGGFVGIVRDQANIITPKAAFTVAFNLVRLL